jgi:hypothetical protein
MRVERLFWRRETQIPAQLEYWAYAHGLMGFGPTPAAAVKSLRHTYRREHSRVPCCGQDRRRA